MKLFLLCCVYLCSVLAIQAQTSSLTRTPEWATSADGVSPALLTNLQLQVQTSYGFKTVGLGDINGDGYDDVAVSAPTMADVVAGNGTLAGVGAVFIYLGSPTGLSTVPNKILQPTTCVAGALFGYSIDAGDITGDGKNDIIIGAPLDSYATTAQGLLGAVNVNVTAGKVYIYRSEDLSGALTNPSPFLSVKLEGTHYFCNTLTASNINVHALFGYSVAVTPDLNGDHRADIVIGTPAYAGTSLLAVQSGAAFVYYSDTTTNSVNPIPDQLDTPTPSLLGLVSLPLANTDGLLFGFSVDGAGDFNNDGYPDVIVGAPAGINLSSLGGIFSGQVLGGSAFIYYGNGNRISSTSSVRLQASPTGLLSNTANLFGYVVKGAENGFGGKTGGLLIGAPTAAVISNVIGGLQVKSGQVHIFKQRSGVLPAAVNADQVISSPRSSSVLGILSGAVNVSLLFGASLDNAGDLNCDNNGDLIVGEPLSSRVTVAGVDVIGGAAYTFKAKADGTFETTPDWDLGFNVSPVLGINGGAMLGFSVAGAGYVKGHAQGLRSMTGGPLNSLDFGSGLLDLGPSLSTLFNFAFDSNGVGKAYTFANSSCAKTLPVTLTTFTARASGHNSVINWSSSQEDNLHHYSLERSVDGIHFSAIAIVFGKGAVKNDYQFTDTKPANGMNFYRLQSVDNDGKFAYSDIAIVSFGDAMSSNIVVAPNPSGHTINIQATGLKTGTNQLVLTNLSGQTIAIKNITITAASQHFSFSVPDAVNKGIYLLQISDSDHQLTGVVKVVIAH